MAVKFFSLLGGTHQAGKMSLSPGHLNAVRETPAVPDFLLRPNLADDLMSFADRNRWLLWAVMMGFYAAAFNGQWRIQPDAALYLSIGRNLAHGLGYTYLGEPERLAHPGWPAIIAITFKLFGAKSLVPVQSVIMLISLATVASVYRLVLIHSGRPTAVAVSLGTGMTKAFFCYSLELWSDMPFALGVMCALAGFEGLSVNQGRDADTRRSNAKLAVDLLFLIGGLLIAASMRPTIWPLLAAMVIASFLRAFRRRNWRWAVPGMVAGLIAAVGICQMLGLAGGAHGIGIEYGEYLVNRLSGHDTSLVTHSLLDNLRDLFTWAASDVLFQTRLGPVVNALLSLLVLILGFGLFQYRTLWGLWFCLLLPTILMAQVTLDRYFLPVLPLLVFAWWDLLVQINRRIEKPWANIAFIALFAFGGLMNITKVCGIIMQQHQRPFLAQFDHGTFDNTPEFARKLHDTVGDKAIVLIRAPYGRVTAYLSERYVTGAVGLSVDQMHSHRVFVAEPSDVNTQQLLRAAGLVEDPALFTVNPSPAHGPWATSLSLHPTHRAVK